MALVGMAQVSSRYWLSTEQAIPKDAAEQLSPARLARHSAAGPAPPEPPAARPALVGLAAPTVRLQASLGCGEERRGVKIGIQSVPRELVVETKSSFEEVERALAEAVADGGVFTLEDDKERQGPGSSGQDCLPGGWRQ